MACSFVLFAPECVLLESNVWKVSVTSGKMFVCLYCVVRRCVGNPERKEYILRDSRRKQICTNDETNTKKPLCAYFIIVCFLNWPDITHTSTEDQRLSDTPSPG